jgi:lipopolysaccharide biosynthesis regulator YciM
MDFELAWLQWGLLAIPVAFALGWLASRFDLKQWRREQRNSPKPYFKGLNLLLNEQQDKAIDAFIEAVQQDPQSSDLHFALGNLFRRRGEFERAVRVHEHLLNRADLPQAERQRAQHALAQDFMKAGLFDRAEAAYRALEGTPFDTEARLALLGLYERSRDWKSAAEIAGKLEKSGTGSFAARIAHHWCELAQEADERGQTAEADDALQRARQVAPHAARPLVLQGLRQAKAGQHAAALDSWNELRLRTPAAFLLVAADYARSALAAHQAAAAFDALQAMHTRQPSIDLLHALAIVDPDVARQRERAQAFIAAQPTLSAASDLLQLPAALWTDEAIRGVRQAVERAAKPLRRYRCAACGFEAQHYFWQCPGCLSWDSYPPLRIEEL